MKTIINRLLLVLLLWTIGTHAEAAVIPAKPMTDAYVYDYSDVIDAQTEETLNTLSKQLDEATSAQIFVMTTPSILPFTAAEFGTKVIREWGIGQAELNNGMFIFVTTAQGDGQNDVWISVGQGLEGRFPDGKLGRLIDEYMVPHLLQGDYSTAFRNIYSAVYNDIGEEYNWQNSNIQPAPTEGGSGSTLILIIFIFIVLVSLFSGGGGSGGGRTRRYYGGTGSFGGGFSGGSRGGFRGGGGSSAGGGAGRKF